MNENRKNNCKRSNRSRKGTKSAKGFDKSREVLTDEHKTNDPSWYASDPALLRDAASIPMSWAGGSEIDLKFKIDEWFNTEDQHYSAPGICALRLYPNVGYAQSANDPINIAANAIYTFDRQANSGASNYDAPDLMMYIMAMSSVYSYINYLQRIYGTVRMYSQQNKYMPKELLVAYGVDPDDVKNHMADFRFGINVLISKVASMVVPNTMSIFLRHAFLYQNVYIGGPTAKDQLYLFIPAAFYKFEEMAGGGSLAAGTLKFAEIPTPNTAASGNGLTVAKLLELGDQLIDPIWRSDSARIMSGDLKKAYGENIIKLESLPVDYIITPIYDQRVLEQMKNATCVGDIDCDGVSQSQDKGYLMNCPTTINTFMQYPLQQVGNADVISQLIAQDFRGSRILTTSDIESSPEMIIENTRLMATCAQNAAENNPIFAGSEICSKVYMCTMQYNLNGNYLRTVWTEASMFGDVVDYDMESPGTTGEYPDTKAVVGKCSELARFANFKYHPMVRLRVWRHKKGTTADIECANTIKQFDVDNFGIVTPEVLRKLHEAALMNEFAVPSFGKAR